MSRLFFNPFTGQFFKIIARRRKARKAPTGPRVEEMRAQAQEQLPPRLAQLATRYGFSYNRVVIKNNISNWGSCSSKKNINLNLRLVTLPQDLQDYVMLHELCHLRHLNHGPEFHALLDNLCSDYYPNENARTLAGQLRAYKLV